MNIDDIILPGDLAWLDVARETLLAQWRAARPVDPTGAVTPLVCEILTGVPPGAGHFSLPCSVAEEDEAIERHLEDAQTALLDPIGFFRFYLFLLDEFGAGLECCYQLLGHRSASKAPSLVSTWTNRYAKHRGRILVCHHPKYLFRDNPDAAPIEPELRANPDVTIIDRAWLEQHVNEVPKVRQMTVNRGAAVVVVPRLGDFLSAMLKFYGDFVTYAKGHSAKLNDFYAPSHADGIVVEAVRRHERARLLTLLRARIAQVW
jgi:hypothetical protein